MIESLDVILWDKKVGTLVANREGHRSKACFYFDSDYVRDGYDIAPLRAPVKGVAAQRGLPVYPDEERLFGGLPSFIADSLPDHWGNTVFNEWAKVHHIRMRDLSALDRLAYIGRRGMGHWSSSRPLPRNWRHRSRWRSLTSTNWPGRLSRKPDGSTSRYRQPDGRKPVQGRNVRRRTTAQSGGQRQFRGRTMLLRTGGDPLSGLHADDRQVRRTPEDADDTDRIQLLPDGRRRRASDDAEPPVGR